MKTKISFAAPVLEQFYAPMAELVDALVSNTSAFTGMPVRARLGVRLKKARFWAFFSNFKKMKKPSFDEIYMELAEKLALRSHCVKAQVGAVLTKDTRIISLGYNGPPAGTHNCDQEWPEHGCPRETSETPHEYAQRLAARPRELLPLARHLTTRGR